MREILVKGENIVKRESNNNKEKFKKIGGNWRSLYTVLQSVGQFASLLHAMKRG